MLQLARHIQAETPRFAVRLFVGATALFAAAVVHHQVGRSSTPRSLPTFAAVTPDGKFEARANGTLAFDAGRGLALVAGTPTHFSLAADLSGHAFPATAVLTARGDGPAPHARTASASTKAAPVAVAAAGSFGFAPLPPLRDVTFDTTPSATERDLNRRMAAMVDDQVRSGRTSTVALAEPARFTVGGSGDVLRPPRPVPGGVSDRERRPSGFFRVDLLASTPRHLIDSGLSGLREVGSTSNRLISQLFD